MRKRAVEKKMIDSLIYARNVMSQTFDEYILEGILTGDVSDEDFERFCNTLNSRLKERLGFLKNDLKALQKIKEAGNDSSEDATEK